MALPRNQVSARLRLGRINGQLPCHITFTTEKTAQIIRANLHKSPMYSGVIEGVGPRYCPSIEDKIVKFPEKERHQIFLEPEGIETDEIYVNGFSTMPAVRCSGGTRSNHHRLRECRNHATGLRSRI